VPRDGPRVEGRLTNIREPSPRAGKPPNWVSDGASPTIAGNTITGNALEAIRVDEDAEPKIDQNVISN